MPITVFLALTMYAEQGRRSILLKSLHQMMLTQAGNRLPWYLWEAERAMQMTADTAVRGISRLLWKITPNASEQKYILMT